MKPCFITQKDEIFGDMNTFRIWRRWGSLRAFGDSTFEIQAGWFYSFSPGDHMPYWLFNKSDRRDIEDFLGETPGGYERMIRIEIVEPEDLVIELLLNELDGV